MKEGKRRVAVSGFSMGMFLAFLMAIGAGAILLDGQRAASGGASARVGMLETERGALRAQLYDALTTPPPQPVASGVIRVARNAGVANPLQISGATSQTIASFTVSNETNDALMLRKAIFLVPANSRMTAVMAYLTPAGGARTRLGSSITVGDQSTPKEISFSNATGLRLDPHSSATLEIVGKPSFITSKTPAFLTFTGAEVFASSLIAIDGQGLNNGANPIPPPTPGQPTGLTATPGNRQIALSWNPTPGAAWYILKRGVGSTSISSEFTVQNATTYLDQNLTNGTEYFYVLRAANTGGQGQASEWASATPVAPAAAPVASLSASINQSLGAPSYVAGAANVRVGSFILSNPSTSTQAAHVSSLSFDKDANANFDVQNLKVMVGGAQIGSARAIVADTEVSMAFPSASPIVVPVGASVIIDLYADILVSSTKATHAAVFDLVGGAAAGQTSNTAIPFPASSGNQVMGQNITIGASGSLSLANDPDNAIPARYLVMGSTDQAVYRMKMTAGSAEDVRVVDMTFVDEIAGNAAGIVSLQNVRIYDESDAILVGPVNMVLSQTGLGRIQFMLGNSSTLIIPKGTSRTVTVKADIAPFVSGAAKSGSKHRIGIVSVADVVAIGRDSNASVSVTGTPSGNEQAIYRTKPSLVASLVDVPGDARDVKIGIRGLSEDIATMTWSATSTDDVVIESVKVSLSGAAINGMSAPTTTVALIDANTNAIWAGPGQLNLAPSVCSKAGGKCVATMTPNAAISRGSSKAIKLRVKSSVFGAGSFKASIETSEGVLWSDGSSFGVKWEANLIPITIVIANYQ